MEGEMAVPIPMDLGEGASAQSPAKGLGPFDPGPDPGEECVKGGGGPASQAFGAGRDPKGKSNVPSGFASGTRKRGPSPSGEKAFPREPLATAKEGPFHRGIWNKKRPGQQGE